MKVGTRTRKVDTGATTKTGKPKPESRFDGVCACGFETTDWPTREIAEARIGQHAAEHETGEPMPSLSVFRAEKELGVNPDGSTFVLPAGVEPVGEEH